MFHFKWIIGFPSFPRKYGRVIRIRIAMPYVWLVSGPEKIPVFPNRPCNQIRAGIKLHQSTEETSVEKSLFIKEKIQCNILHPDEIRILSDLWIEDSSQINP